MEEKKNRTADSKSESERERQKENARDDWK